MINRGSLILNMIHLSLLMGYISQTFKVSVIKPSLDPAVLVNYTSIHLQPSFYLKDRKSSFKLKCLIKDTYTSKKAFFFFKSFTNHKINTYCMMW